LGKRVALKDSAGSAPARHAGVARHEDADAALVSGALGGDTGAFDDLVRRHECRVFRTAMAITGNEADAEDALQDTFLNAYTHLREFRRDSRFSTWLTRIAINAALHKVRRRREVVSLDEPDAESREFVPANLEDWRSDPERVYEAEEARRIVRQALEALPPPYRVVLALRDVAEMDTVETAEVLGLTIAAVKSRLLRARLMVREHLAGRFARKPGWASGLRRMSWMVRGMMGARARVALRKEGG
jgi:RNA polymerase sigma-70 factor (ECF subfamily)